MSVATISQTDRMWDIFKQSATSKNLYLNGCVGDKETWSVAISDKRENINRIYIIVDYVDWEEKPFSLTYYNHTDKNNIIESLEIGEYKKINATIKKIMKQLEVI